MAQLHKRFTDAQLKDMLTRYLKREIEGLHIRAVLGLSKTHFFRLLTRYQTNPATFSIQYTRRTPTRRLDPHIEQAIVRELTIDQQAIQNPQIPLRYYNYSFPR